MRLIRRHFPFNTEQTVNILSEFGPLITMFVVNAIYGIEAGTWALLATTILAIITMLIVLRRLPVFPLIASAVTFSFGTLALVTGDPMWVQLKVTIFNALFAVFLLGGLWLGKNFFKYVFGTTFFYTHEGWDKFTKNFAWFFIFTAVANEIVRVSFADFLYYVGDYRLDGINIWILFKIFIIMPISGLFAWWQTQQLQKYRLPAPATGRAAAERVR
jgi:intracellular septation protein